MHFFVFFALQYLGGFWVCFIKEEAHLCFNWHLINSHKATLTVQRRKSAFGVPQTSLLHNWMILTHVVAERKRYVSALMWFSYISLLCLLALSLVLISLFIDGLDRQSISVQDRGSCGPACGPSETKPGESEWRRKCSSGCILQCFLSWVGDRWTIASDCKSMSLSLNSNLTGPQDVKAGTSTAQNSGSVTMVTWG